MLPFLARTDVLGSGSLLSTVIVGPTSPLLDLQTSRQYRWGIINAVPRDDLLGSPLIVHWSFEDVYINLFLAYPGTKPLLFQDGLPIFQSKYTNKGLLPPFIYIPVIVLAG
jgi:hypothetical protein